MRILLTLLFLFFLLHATSQNSANFYFDMDTRLLNYIPLSEDMKGVVKEVRIKQTFSKEKNNSSIQKQYDENGLVTFYESNDRNGQLKVKSEANYNSKGNLVQFKSYSTKGIQKERLNTYDSELRLIETVLKNKNGKITYRSTWSYGEGNCATQSSSFKAGGKKVKRIWNFEYYKECDRKKTTLSNAKGKVLNTWTYDCKEEGQQLTKKKDENQVCKWEESDGKYLTRVYQNFDEKGRIRKTVQKFNLSDTSIVESTLYNSRDQMIYKWTYDGSFDRQTSYTAYKNGKIEYQRLTEYVDGRIQSDKGSRKGKKIYEVLYTYNEKNWLVKIENLDKKGKLYKTEEYEYVL